MTDLVQSIINMQIELMKISELIDKYNDEERCKAETTIGDDDISDIDAQLKELRMDLISVATKIIPTTSHRWWKHNLVGYTQEEISMARSAYAEFLGRDVTWKELTQTSIGIAGWLHEAMKQ